MKLLCCSFEELNKKIREGHHEIVMFGAGVLGQVTMPQILLKYGLLPFIRCYLDNDKAKWGSRIELFGRSVPVNSPSFLEKCKKNTVILLNISRFPDVIEQLQGMQCTEEMECYITPMLCIYNFCSSPSKGEPKLLEKPAIPKKIHYMWLGRKPVPGELQKCLDSWRRFCPDYEIIEWNEDNYDITENSYMKQAYEAGAYGFVPDYARLDILYHHGGFYLDTDVEIKRSIEELRYQEAFCGVEKWQTVNFGGLSGAVKGNPMIRRFLDARKTIDFIDKDGQINKNTCGFYDTRVALDAGYVVDGTTQNICGMNIYAYDYFQPYDYMSGMLNSTVHTYSVHWFHEGWIDEKMKKANEEAAECYTALFEECRSNSTIYSAK